VHMGGDDPKRLTADVRAQTREFNAWQRDLARLKRRGGSKQLLADLTSQGVAGDPAVHALAGASRKDLASFLSAYKQREKAVRQAARDAAPKVFVNVTLDGKKIADAVTVRMQKSARHTSGQRGGRHPGTVHGIH